MELRWRKIDDKLIVTVVGRNKIRHYYLFIPPQADEPQSVEDVAIIAAYNALHRINDDSVRLLDKLYEYNSSLVEQAINAVTEAITAETQFEREEEERRRRAEAMRKFGEALLGRFRERRALAAVL